MLACLLSFSEIASANNIEPNQDIEFISSVKMSSSNGTYTQKSELSKISVGESIIRLSDGTCSLEKTTLISMKKHYIGSRIYVEEPVIEKTKKTIECVN
jgi:hypothetical protein